MEKERGTFTENKREGEGRKTEEEGQSRKSEKRRSVSLGKKIPPESFKQVKSEAASLASQHRGWWHTELPGWLLQLSNKLVQRLAGWLIYWLTDWRVGFSLSCVCAAEALLLFSLSDKKAALHTDTQRTTWNSTNTGETDRDEESKKTNK